MKTLVQGFADRQRIPHPDVAIMQRRSDQDE